MPRPKGLIKTGGRKKGTPNRATQNLVEALDTLNFDIPSKIYELLPKLSSEKQVDVLLKLMEFVYPKVKAIEPEIQKISFTEELMNFRL